VDARHHGAELLDDQGRGVDADAHRGRPRARRLRRSGREALARVRPGGPGAHHHPPGDGAPVGALSHPPDDRPRRSTSRARAPGTTGSPRASWSARSCSG
jgi:hypothetical protein